MYFYIRILYNESDILQCSILFDVVLKSKSIGDTIMNKKMKAALAGLAFVAGCEIGIAIQLVKMVHKFTVRETAMNEAIPEDALDAALDAEEEREEPQ